MARNPRAGLVPALILSFAFLSSSSAVRAAPAEDECRTKPGKTAPAGEHWYYNIEDGKHCWYTAPAAKPAKAQRHERVASAAKDDVPSGEEAPAKAAPKPAPAPAPLAVAKPVTVKTVVVKPAPVDAYAEMTADAPAMRQAPPQTQPVPQLSYIQPVAEQMAATSPIARLANAVPQVDVDAVMAAMPDPRDIPPTKSAAAVAPVSAVDEARSPILTVLGVLLIMFGAVALVLRPIADVFSNWFQEWREERLQDGEQDVPWRFAFGREDPEAMPFRSSAPLRGLPS